MAEGRLGLVVAGALVIVLGACLAAYARHVHIWILPYLWGALRRAAPAPRSGRPVDILFCVADHFEPASLRQVQPWIEAFPLLAAAHRDSDGRPPRHTWFYPCEQYQPECLDALARLAAQGLGEIEIHLHHGPDTARSLRERILDGLEKFQRHGAVVSDCATPRTAYGFIHGNLALDNSMGRPELCGVNNEFEILAETGCYADFSLPTAPAPSQTRKINTIYYAVGDPRISKAHDRGIDAEVGSAQRPGLLLIQGPLALDWRRRKFGLLPHIDNAEITRRYPPTADRIRRWVRQHVHVKGRHEWVVVKVSCHGAEERHTRVLLGEHADRMYASLEAMFRDREGYRLHYVTARELYNIVKAAEAGHDGNPDRYRDFIVPPYRNSRVGLAEVRP